VLLDQRQQEIKSKQQLLAEGASKIERLEQKLKEQKSLTEKAQKDHETLNQNLLKLQQDRNEQININTQLLAENSQRQIELAKKADEISLLSQKEVNANK
jgi:hypothetical protein